MPPRLTLATPFFFSHLPAGATSATNDWRRRCNSSRAQRKALSCAALPPGATGLDGATTKLSDSVGASRAGVAKLRPTMLAP